MSGSEQLDVTSTDLLGAINFDATRLITAIQSFAVGGPPPNTENMVKVIRGMLSKAEAVHKFQSVLGKVE